MKNIDIRLATPADLPALTAIGALTFREAYAAQNTAADIDHYVNTYLNEHYTLLDLQDPNTVFHLACDAQNNILGYSKLKKMPADLLDKAGDILEIKRIYVLQKHHGSGIAQGLMQAAENFAREKKLAAMNLAVWKENPRAIAFYLKCGFEKIGSTTFDWGTGKIDDDWVMQRTF